MSAPIDESQVRHIAKLARLDLSDDEVRRFAGQLGDILTYVEKLREVDTEGVEPMAHAMPITDVFRSDEPRTGLTQDHALQNAPAREQGFFKVPAVLDQGGGA